jgi:uncharacterized protein YhbP (UPF0306 family)
VRGHPPGDPIFTTELRAAGYPHLRLALSVRGMLASVHLCSIATRGDGGVHINTAFFAWREDLVLYFLSRPSTQHAANLLRTPAMAWTVFDSRQVWGEPHRGLQMFGTGSRVSEAERREAERVYGARFPGYLRLRASAVAADAPGFDALQLYRFTPSSLKLLDEPEFGHEVFITVEIVRSGRGLAT